MAPRLLTFVATIGLLALPCYALTEYVSDNNVIVVQSVIPCHLDGDPDLYGLGIRLSFYFTWAILIFAIGLGITEEAMPLRNNLILLFLALFIVLIRSALRGSFALFEWWIIDSVRIGLILPILITLFRHISKIPTPEDDTKDKSKGPDQTINGANLLQKIKIYSSKFFGFGLPHIHNPPQERDKIFCADAIGFGFLYVLTGLFGVCTPWLYFKMTNSGHREGCLIRVVLFGPINLYNAHVQTFLKFWSIFWVVLGAFMVIFGGSLLFSGFRKWEAREEAMKSFKEKKDRYWQKLDEAEDRLVAEVGYETNIFVQYGSPIDDSQPVELERGPLTRTMARHWTQDGDRAQVIFWDSNWDEVIAAYEKFKDHERHSRSVRRRAVVLHVLWGGAAISFIEVTIRVFGEVSLQDSIADSTGQLLSLLLALFGILTFSYDAFRHRRKKRKDRKKIRETARKFAARKRDHDRAEARQQPPPVGPGAV